MRSWVEKTGITGGETISFEQCWELSKRWYPGRAELAWNPKTVDEMERILAAVGLTSEFWKLRTWSRGSSLDPGPGFDSDCDP